jgi:hypothetical protein
MTVAVLLLATFVVVFGQNHVNPSPGSLPICRQQVDLRNVVNWRCGNGICQLGEPCVTCASDCGTCPSLFNSRVSLDASAGVRSVAQFDDGALRNRMRLNRALLCGEPSFTESSCYQLISAVQHGPSAAVPTGTLNYGVFTKQKANGPRKGDGNQAALFLQMTRTNASVWFGVREPLCDARLKSTRPTQERAGDEFGVMMLIAYAIDVLIDAGFVPTTALVELDVAAHEAAAVDDALPILCAFQEFGAANVIEQQVATGAPRKVLGVAQSTVKAESKGDPTRGVRLIHDSSTTLLSLVVEFSVLAARVNIGVDAGLVARRSPRALAWVKHVQKIDAEQSRTQNAIRRFLCCYLRFSLACPCGNTRRQSSIYTLMIETR